VRPVSSSETVGHIVLLDDTRERWASMQGEVVAVGAPQVCEDEDCELPHIDHTHPVTVAVGDWLVMRPRCFVATDEPDVWICPQSAVLARLQMRSA